MGNEITAALGRIAGAIDNLESDDKSTRDNAKKEIQDSGFALLGTFLQNQQRIADALERLALAK